MRDDRKSSAHGQIRVKPRRRLETVVNKVADSASNLRLKALPVGLGAFITRPGEVVMDRLKHSLEDRDAPTCPTCGIEMQWCPVGACQICPGNQSAAVQLSDLLSVGRVRAG
jgi:hypothetical protein